MVKKLINNPFIKILALILLVSSCSKRPDETTSASWSAEYAGDTVIAVEVLEVSLGHLYPEVQAAGIISGIKEAYVISETKGLIKELKFEIGDLVTINQSLLKVDDKIARLSMEQAKQQYETARIDLEGVEAFYDKGNASISELARARSASNGALALYETARKIYEDSTLRSPIDGAVAWKDTSAALGNYLSQGMRVAKIVDLSSIKVEISLGERQIGLVRTGAPVNIYIDSVCGDKPIPGKVTAIAAGSDMTTGSFAVIVEALNICGDSLRAGMSSTVIIETSTIKDEIIVPSSSIVEREGKEYVFLNRDGIAEAVEINIGEMMGNRTSIISGPEEKDQLIISGVSSMRPGMKVNSRVVGKSGEWL